MINHVKLKIRCNKRNPQYGIHALEVAFNAEEEMNFLTPWRVCVFTEHLCLVLNTDMKRAVHSQLDEDVYRCIFRTTCYPWMPGRYFMTVSDGSDWCVRVDFELNIELEAHVLDITPRSKSDVEWTLTNDVDWKAKSTRAFFSTPATYHLKLRALQLHKYDNYSKWSDKVSIPVLPGLRHLVIYTTGNNGKDAVRLFGHFISSINHYECEFVDCASLYDKTHMEPYEALNNLVGRMRRGPGKASLFLFDNDDSDEKNYLLFLTGLDTLMMPQGNYITRQLSCLPSNCHLVLVGTKDEVEQVQPMFGNAILKVADQDRLTLNTPYIDEAMSKLMFRLSFSYNPTLDAQDKLSRAFYGAYTQGKTHLLSSEFVDSLVDEHILPHLIDRINGLDITDYTDFDGAAYIPRGCKVVQLQASDIDLSSFDEHVDSYEDCLRELNQMVGLKMVKDDIRTTANRVRFLAERNEQGLPCEASSNGHHIVLTGNPGTGKTTVARLLGRIYHQLGLISKGDVVMTERSKIVGEYIGQTEQNMQMILSRAKGNVLFIDEAYSLFEGGKDSKDFGQHAIECLLTMLSKPNPDILVVLAGYEQPMREMLQSNPGLPGRFPYHFHFPDYTEDELIEICDRLIDKNQYVASDEVHQMLHDAIHKEMLRKDEFFANARWVQQLLFDGVVPAMADRLASQPRPLSKQQLTTIAPSDVEAAVEKMAQRPQANRRPTITGFGVHRP